MKLLAGHLERLRACFAGLPDPRRGRNRRYPMADVAMAALSVFFMQSPSFLAHQRALAEGRTRSNAHTLFGLARIPCDNHTSGTARWRAACSTASACPPAAPPPAPAAASAATGG